MAKDKTRTDDTKEETKTAPADGNAGQTMGAQAVDLTAADYKGKKVKMDFPRPVRILVEGHRGISFEAGIQEVPAELKDHWYLKAHKVKEV